MNHEINYYKKIALSIISILLSTHVLAETPIALYKSFEGNIAVTTIGNSELIETGGNGNCGTGTAASDTLALPAGATVKAAYLYWYAMTENQTDDNFPFVEISNTSPVTFPGHSGTITATRNFSDTKTEVGLGYWKYSGRFADVTSLVTSTPNGSYTVDIQGGASNSACGFTEENVRGWNLVVVYDAPSLTENKKIYIYDGMKGYLTENISIPVSGFEVPAGSTAGSLTVVSIQGAVNILGEYMNTSDASFPAFPADFANSNQGSALDIDTLTGNFTAGSTSMNINSGSNLDLILTTNIILTIPTVPAPTNDCGSPVFLETFGSGIGRTNIPSSASSTVYKYDDGSGFTGIQDPWLIDATAEDKENGINEGWIINNRDIRVGDGEYATLDKSSIANAGYWWIIDDDHTGDVNGHMLMVNASYDPGEFYRHSITGLTVDTKYSFAAYIANADNMNKSPDGSDRLLPNVKFSLESNGSELTSVVTGVIPQHPNKNKLDWKKYELIFTATHSDLDIVLSDSNPGGGGNDLVIDDISLSEVCPNKFSCDVDAYMTHSAALNSPSDITSIDIAAATSQLEQSNIHPKNINAIGYNVVDNYIWGYDQQAEKVLRIDSNYDITSYTIPDLPQNAYHIGDVSQDGVLYLAERHVEPDKIYRVDVDPSSATYLQKLPTITLSNNSVFTASDFAFHPADGMLYIPNANGHLYKIDSSTGVITDVGDMQIAGYSNSNVTFFDKNGYYYINNSSDDTIYRINLSNPASPNPIGSAFSTIAIPSEADGARCPNAPIGTTLTVVHNVINDNGGTNSGSDFGITSNPGTLVFSSTLISGDTTTDTSDPMVVPAGDVVLTAPALSGYAHTASWWSCSGSQELVVLNSMNNGTLTATVTIAEGDSVTCTVTYDDDDEATTCGALSGEVNVAISPISILRTETSEFKNKLFIATTDNDATIMEGKGHLKAYAIGSNELPSSTVSWDAATVMTTQRRGTHLFSTVNNGLVAFNALPAESFLSTGVPSFETIRTNIANAKMGAISPNSKVALLQDTVKPLMYLDEPDYRSFYTSVIANRSALSGATVPAQVMVTSDDGFLYSFNQFDGNLNWGWMPPSLALELKHQAQFPEHHYMQGTIDQLDLKSGSSGSYSFASYIAGSYRNGLGQYVLKLANDSSLDSVIWDTDHKDANSLADSAPNHGQRAYFSDANGKPYMVYIITAGTDSVLHIRSMTDASIHEQIVLGFTATSTPFVMPDFRKPASPVINTLYLGADNGNIYSAALLVDDANGHKTVINTGLSTSFSSSATPIGTIHPAGHTSSAVLYLGASLAVGGRYHLYAQAEDRFTLFNYNSSDTNWSPNWTTTTGAAGKWVTTEGTATYEADAAISSLVTGDRITDQAYVIANSVVLPITAAPVAPACHGVASYSFYKLPNGQTPTKTFYNTSDHSAITSGTLSLGAGEAMRLHLTTLPTSKKLIALGLAEHDSSSGTGVSNSFYINDPVTSGIRSWKELH